MRKIGDFRIGAISEDYNGKFLLRETRDAGREANRIAAMPKLPKPPILANIPTETVAATWMIRLDGRRKGESKHFSADKFRGVERLVPLGKVGHGRINAAIAQHGTGQALVSALETRSLE